MGEKYGQEDGRHVYEKQKQGGLQGSELTPGPHGRTRSNRNLEVIEHSEIPAPVAEGQQTG